MRYFTSDHEWLELDGVSFVVGITDFAQSQLGDIVFIEMPAIGKRLVKGETVAVVESVKIASDIYAPVGGEVSAVNQLVATDPSVINRDPEGSGWLFKLSGVSSSELEGLMDVTAYSNSIA